MTATHATAILLVAVFVLVAVFTYADHCAGRRGR